MRAIVHDRYGPPEVLRVDEVERPMPAELRRVLKPGATVVVLGRPRANRLLGPLGHVVGSRLRAIRGSQRATFFIAKFNEEDMETLRDLMESGKLTSVIDSTYPLDEIAGALQHMGEGHPRGKIVVTV
ncbi:MAG: zinc-binding dehydrogenase [Gaiellaceae bacterium]